MDSKQISELKRILADNPKLLLELGEYKIPTLTTIYNTDLQIDNQSDLEKTLQLVSFIKEGRTFLEIENEMKRLDIMRLKPRNYGNYSFQLFNFDEEYKDKRKIW